jgi:hypothetical protein
VNWAKAITFIACEKAWREEARKMKSGSMGIGERGSRKGIGERLGKFECKFYSFELTQTTKGIEKETTMCLYGVLDANMSKISNVYILVQELVCQCQKKVTHSQAL